jgi:G:T-mismatch repair DNA endonuclease (very short patch repair protein)
LKSEGWRVLVVWECRLRRTRNPNNADLIIKIAQWTSSGGTSASI